MSDKAIKVTVAMHNLGKYLARTLSPEQRRRFMAQMREDEAEARIQLAMCGGLAGEIDAGVDPKQGDNA